MRKSQTCMCYIVYLWAVLYTLTPESFLTPYRRRLFDTSSVPDSDESDLDDYTVTSPLQYFNNYPELPVYSETSSGYNLPELISILMSASASDDKVCHVQPLGVSQNCTIIIDLDSVTVNDLKADDLGSWKSTGTRRAYFILNKKSQPEFLSRVPLC